MKLPNGLLSTGSIGHLFRGQSTAITRLGQLPSFGSLAMI